MLDILASKFLLNISARAKEIRRLLWRLWPLAIQTKPIFRHNVQIFTEFQYQTVATLPTTPSSGVTMPQRQQKKIIHPSPSSPPPPPPSQRCILLFMYQITNLHIYTTRRKDLTTVTPSPNLVPRVPSCRREPWERGWPSPNPFYIWATLSPWRAMASDVESKEFDKNRLYIKYCNVLGLLLLGLTTTASYNFEGPLVNLPTMTDRIVFTLRLQMLSAMTVVFGIIWVANTRFYTPAMDTFSQAAQHHVAIPTRYLQNTVEQFVLSFVGNLVLTTYLPSNKMHMIAVFVALFVAGRLAFALGYRRYYVQRAFGFVLTFMPTVSVYIFCLYCSAKDAFGFLA